jgi:hypothetical protein
VKRIQALVLAVLLSTGIGCSESGNSGSNGNDGTGLSWKDTGTTNPPQEDTYINFDADVIACTAEEIVCATPFSTRQCSNFGDSWGDPVPCPEGNGCDNGLCIPQVCLPGESSGECLTPASYDKCNAGGTAWGVYYCENATKCVQGICIASLCTPGARICKSPTQVMECDVSGDFWNDGEICSSGGLCNDGFCLSPCDVNIKSGSYLGCDYWAMDLDNIEESETAPIGIVVSVPANKTATEVKISTAGVQLDPATLGVANGLVQPGEVKTFVLPSGFDVDGTQKTDKTFHIETTAPVAVHQFNPLNGDGVYTNDASLLLPSNVTGKEYVVMSWPHRNDGIILRGFFTMIATQPGFTEIKVVPSSQVAAGFGVAQLSPGNPYLFVLAQGEAINFETDGEHGSDLTGTTIQASQKISVISGHECANVPLGITACDHMEQQLFPLESWSTEYFADAFKARSADQVDIYRVIAGDTDVLVETIPPLPGYESFKLQKGNWIQFASGDSFKIKSNGPILVGHFLTGANYPGAVDRPECEFSAVGKPEPIGDPAFTLAAPVKRYLKEYAVLTPSGYMEGENYVNIIAPDGTAVTIDGLPVTAPFKSIPGTGYSIATQGVVPGVHTVQADKAFGLTAYGYDCDVSYAYPGGLKLQSIDE